MVVGDVLARHVRALLEDVSPEAHGLSTGTAITYAMISVALVLFAGAMSGLTLGLMGMDVLDLEVLRRSGTESEARQAAAIIPLIQDAHFLLVTLLLCNAAAMEALPIFLDKLMGEVVAIVVSVTAVLFAGEVIPQAVCSKHGLSIGSFMATPVRLLMLITSPISFPVAKLLDFALGGEHASLFRRKQLKALVTLHAKDEGFGGKLSSDEIQIITGALDLTRKTAYQAMTPLDKVFMLSCDQKLDDATVSAVMAAKPFSRLPVHRGTNRQDVVGVILVKELLEYIKGSPDATVGQLKIRQLPRLPADTPMYDLLKLFRVGASHMALLTQPSPSSSEEEDEVEEARARENGGADGHPERNSGGSFKRASDQRHSRLETVHEGPLPPPSHLLPETVHSAPVDTAQGQPDPSTADSEQAALLGGGMKGAQGFGAARRSHSDGNVLLQGFGAGSGSRVLASIKQGLFGGAHPQAADLADEGPLLYSVHASASGVQRVSPDPRKAAALHGSPFKTAAPPAGMADEAALPAPPSPVLLTVDSGRSGVARARSSSMGTGAAGLGFGVGGLGDGGRGSASTLLARLPSGASRTGSWTQNDGAVQNGGGGGGGGGGSAGGTPSRSRNTTLRNLFGGRDSGQGSNFSGDGTGAEGTKSKRRRRKEQRRKSRAKSMVLSPPPECASFDIEAAGDTPEGAPSVQSGLSSAVKHLRRLRHRIIRGTSGDGADPQGPTEAGADSTSGGSGSSSSTSTASTDGSGSSRDDLEDMLPVPLLASPGEAIGIICLEDIFEELIGSEIVDETDKWLDNEQSIPVNTSGLEAALPDHLQDVLHVAQRVKNQVLSPAAGDRQSWLLQAAAGVMGGTSTAHSTGQPATSVLAGLAGSVLRQAFGGGGGSGAGHPAGGLVAGGGTAPPLAPAPGGRALGRSSAPITASTTTAGVRAASPAQVRAEASGGQVAVVRPRFSVDYAVHVEPKHRRTNSKGGGGGGGSGPGLTRPGGSGDAAGAPVQRRDIYTATVLAASLGTGTSGRPPLAAAALTASTRATPGSSATRRSFANWKALEGVQQPPTQHTPVQRP